MARVSDLPVIDNVTKRLPEGHVYCRKSILDNHGFLNYNATHGESLHKYM